MVAQSAERAKRRRILEPLVRSGRGLLRSGLFSVEECAARLECKVQPAIRGHYADGGQHQIYDASPGQFAPVIVHDSPLFPVLTFEGHCGGRRAARLISPQCGAAATPDPRSISSSATGHIAVPRVGTPFAELRQMLLVDAIDLGLHLGCRRLIRTESSPTSRPERSQSNRISSPAAWLRHRPVRSVLL